MLRDDERRTFDEIVRGLGPLPTHELRPYLMPWWLPPALLGLYVPILVAAAVLLPSPAVAALAVAVGALAGRWARFRHTHAAGSPPIDLGRTPPFIA